MASSIDKQLIENVVSEVLAKLNGTASPAPAAAPTVKHAARPGVFTDVDPAVAAAQEAQEKLSKGGLALREKCVQVVKKMCLENAGEWGKLELDETKIGRLDHKIEKLQGLMGVPGTEWLAPYGMSGDHGISLEEQAPWGVILAISPVTHSIPTIASNFISMVAAGNALVVNAHPGGAKCAATAVAAWNEALEREFGLGGLVSIIEEPSLESFQALSVHPGVSLICVTGGPAVVKAAMASGKRAVCAGPGNPPVVVDETPCLRRASRNIIFGGSYDNNLLCIGEKQIFVVEAVFDSFLRAMEQEGAVQLDDGQLERLSKEAFEEDKGHTRVNRALIGADATKLANVAGRTGQRSELLFAVSDFDHPFVQEEQMMPVLPVVRVRDVEEGIRLARQSEHNYRHSAMMHSTNVDALTKMGKAMDCTLFVKNGSCMAGLGVGGVGYANFSIATTTGEGIATPSTFTRKRRCVMVDNLNVVYG